MVAWYEAYLDAIRAGNHRRALAVVADARAAGIGLPELYLEVFQPALREIGRLWQENEVTVADEHLATAVTQLAMGRLYSDCCTESARRERMILAACADSERHEIGVRMVCDFLELDGWDGRFLGAAVPIDSLVAMVVKHRPDVLALSASIAPNLPRLRAMIEAVRAACGDSPPFILVGGRPFLDDSGLARRLGADATAVDAASAVRLLKERFG